MGYYATGGGILRLNSRPSQTVLDALKDDFDVQIIECWLDLYFNDKYRSCIEESLASVSEYVKDGAVEFTGEDGSHWRFLFENGEMTEENGQVVYDSDPALIIPNDQKQKLISELYDASVTDGKPSVQFADPSDNPSLRRISDVLKRWHVIC